MSDIIVPESLDGKNSSSTCCRQKMCHSRHRRCWKPHCNLTIGHFHHSSINLNSLSICYWTIQILQSPPTAFVVSGVGVQGMNTYWTCYLLVPQMSRDTMGWYQSSCVYPARRVVFLNFYRVDPEAWSVFPSGPSGKHTCVAEIGSRN